MVQSSTDMRPEAPDFNRPVSTVSARTLSKRGSRAEPEKLQDKRGSVNQNRFSWASYKSGQDAIELPGLTSNVVPPPEASASHAAHETQVDAGTAAPPPVVSEEPLGADRASDLPESGSTHYETADERPVSPKTQPRKADDASSSRYEDLN